MAGPPSLMVTPDQRCRCSFSWASGFDAGAGHVRHTGIQGAPPDQTESMSWTADYYQLRDNQSRLLPAAAGSPPQ